MAFRVKLGAFPDEADVLLPVLARKVLPDAQDQHRFLVFELFIVENSSWFVDFWVGIQLRLQHLLVLRLFVVIID
jgi:hypothetical protein